MSKEKCLKRAYEVNQGPGPSGNCGHVSYSASVAPQQSTNFCQCHSSCEEPLEQPSGEQWETYVVSADPNVDNAVDTSKSSPAKENADPNSAKTDADAETKGRCPSKGYMSVGWGGMTKQRCFERAYEVNQGPGPSGNCGHVSYSASAAPQQSNQFCQCHSSCEKPLEQPSNEDWETHVVSADIALSSGYRQQLAYVLSCLWIVSVASATL